MFKALLIVFLASPSLWAQNKKTQAVAKPTTPPAATATADVEAQDFRCEKLTAVPLAEVKAAMIENCNLNKPFSNSLSKMLNDEVYFYCCHTK